MKKLIAILTILVLSCTSAFATAYDYEGVTAEIYQHLTGYETDFEVNYIGSTETIGQDITKAIEKALQYDDYIQYVFKAYNVEYSYSSNDSNFRFHVDYRTDLVKEKLVQGKVIEILKGLHLTGLSDYERIKRIIQYMDTQYSYDESLTKFTAYDLISTNQAVCNGYAELFYLLAKGAGVPVRNQEGMLENTAHLWNLVKIGPSWYTVDVTNFHLYKRDLYTVSSVSSLKSKGYTWTNLVESAVEYMDTVDVNYNSNTYSEEAILSKITSNPLSYALSDTTKALKEKYDRQAELTQWLDNYFNAEPENAPPTAFITASNYVEELKSLPLDPVLLENYVKHLASILKLNSYNLSNWFNLVMQQHTTVLGPKFNETATLKALAYAESQKKVLPTKAFNEQDLKYYTKYLDTLIKKDATTLATYYKQQYQKTKKVPYKDKYTALAKKYQLILK